MINSEYLKNLNDSQKQAVNHLDGPLLIVAGAGSGKTRVLKARITNIIKNNLHLATNSTSKLEGVLTRQTNLSISINPNICLFPSNVNRIYEGKSC